MRLLWRLRPTVLAAMALVGLVMPRMSGWPFAVAVLVVVLLDVRRGGGRRVPPLGVGLGVAVVAVPVALIVWTTIWLWNDAGANIGGAFLWLLGYALLPVGALLQAVASRSDVPATRKRTGVFLAVCVASAGVSIVVPDRGDVPDPIGQIAISVDKSGNPIVVVAVCEKHIKEIDVVLGREGLEDTEPNKVVGTWTATTPITDIGTFNLRRPGRGWIPKTGVKIQPSKLYIVSARATDEDHAEAIGMAFVGSKIATMRSDSVYTEPRYTDPDFTYPDPTEPEPTKLIQHDRATFRADACRSLRGPA